MRSMTQYEPVPTAEAKEMMDQITALVAAKSVQDADGAARIYHPRAVLEVPALRSSARGVDEIRAGFALLPDYRPVLNGYAFAPGTVAAWRKVVATLNGAALGLQTNGRTVEAPLHVVFRFSGGMIDYERFDLDFAELSRASGVSADAFFSLVSEAASARSAVDA